MKIRLIRKSYMEQLLEQIEGNLDLYRNGKFVDLENDPNYSIELEGSIDLTEISSITCTATDHNEALCCESLYKSLHGITSYLARDPRLWTYLTHTLLLPYARIRWPIPADDSEAVKHIRTHFFCMGNRGIERDNAASRLWWMAFLCSKAGSMSLSEALACFVSYTDVRANIIERPTTLQNVELFTAILNRLRDSFNGEKRLFNREKFRKIMIKLNLEGGAKLLPALDQQNLQKLVDSLIYQELGIKNLSEL